MELSWVRVYMARLSRRRWLGEKRGTRLDGKERRVGQSADHGVSASGDAETGAAALLPAWLYSSTFFWFTVAVTIVYSVVYVTTNLNLFFDGSAFSAAVASGRPWELCWCNFPGRFASYSLVSLPASAFGQLSGSGAGAVHVYAGLYIIWPTLGVVATRFIDCTNGRHISVFCNIATLTVPAYVFGFPTEVWIFFGVLWPALACCACAQNSLWRVGLALVLLPVLAFTYEGAIPFFPILAAATIWRCSGIRRSILLAAIVSTLAGWVAVKMFVPGCFEWRPNPFNMLSLGSMINSVSAGIALVLTAWLTAVLFVGIAKLEESKQRYLPLIVSAVVFLVYSYLTLDKLHAHTRYVVRYFVLYQTFVMAAVCVGWLAAQDMGMHGRLGRQLSVLEHALRGRFARQFRQGVSVFIAVSVLTHAYGLAKFLHRWTAANEEIDHIIRSGASVPEGYSLFTLDGDEVVVTPGSGSPSPAWATMSYSVAFHSILRAPGFDTHRIIVPQTPAFPIGYCETAKGIERNPGLIGRHSAELLSFYYCNEDAALPSAIGGPRRYLMRGPHNNGKQG